MSTIQPQARKRIPGVLDVIGIPDAFDDPTLSKAKYIALMADGEVARVAERFLDELGAQLSAEDRFELEELLWAVTATVGITKRARYDVARALEGVPLYLRGAPFLDLVARLWERATSFDDFLCDQGDV